MLSLVHYENSSTASSDDEPTSITPKTEDQQKLDKSYRRNRLPTATTLLGTKKAQAEEQYNNSIKHSGRIRTFKHERGNWVTYVFIPGNFEFLEELQTKCMVLFKHLNKLELPTSEPHISLSRTIVLQYHLIDSFIQGLESALKNTKSFKVSFQHFKIYTNEERTRTFIALQLEDAFNIKMKQLLHKVDNVMRDFKLPTFYSKPSFHISILWCLGDKLNLLQQRMKEIEQYIVDETYDLIIKQINCKCGNKLFSFKLK